MTNEAFFFILAAVAASGLTQVAKWIGVKFPKAAKMLFLDNSK